MIKIMFVCHGNICRSPMAEFVFRDMIKKAGVQDRFFVASSATSTEEIGNPVYPPAKAELKKHGINCDGKRSVQLRFDDYDKYDLFIGMDSANIRNMTRIFGKDPQNKIRKLNAADVADPWYYGNFDVTYADVEKGCRALLESFI